MLSDGSALKHARSSERSLKSRILCRSVVSKMLPGSPQSKSMKEILLLFLSKKLLLGLDYGNTLSYHSLPPPPPPVFATPHLKAISSPFVTCFMIFLSTAWGIYHCSASIRLVEYSTFFLLKSIHLIYHQRLSKLLWVLKLFCHDVTWDGSWRDKSDHTPWTHRISFIYTLNICLLFLYMVSLLVHQNVCLFFKFQCFSTPAP